MYEECYAALGCAIVEQAARDFCEAIRDNDVCKYGNAKHYLQSKLCALHSGRDTLPDVEQLENNTRKFLRLADEKINEMHKAGEKPEEPVFAYNCPICGSKVVIRYGFIAYKKTIKKYSYGYRLNCDGCAFNCYFTDVENEEVKLKKHKKTNITYKKRFLTYKGETKPLAEWAEITGLNYDTIKKRMQRGCTPEECLYHRSLKGKK